MRRFLIFILAAMLVVAFTSFAFAFESPNGKVDGDARFDIHRILSHRTTNDFIVDCACPEIHNPVRTCGGDSVATEGFAVVVIDSDGEAVATAVAVADKSHGDSLDDSSESRGIFCCEPNPPLIAVILYYHYPRANSSLCDGYKENAKYCTRCYAIWPGTPVSIGSHLKGDPATYCPY